MNGVLWGILRGVAALALFAASPVIAHAQGGRTELQQLLDFRVETLAYNIGLQGYIYGYPAVDYMQFMRSEAQPADGRPPRVPQHHIYNAGKLAGPGEGFGGRTPNNDTIYFHSWLDLRESPVIVSAPAVPDRYHLLSYVDFYAEVQHTGMRTTGNGAQQILVAGPNWRGVVPEGMHFIRLRTNQGLFVGRMMAVDAADTAVANKLIAQYNIRPLYPTARPAPLELAPPEALTSIDFFVHLNRFLRENPRLPGEEALMAAFDSQNFGPNSDFDPARLSPAARRGFERALVDGHRLIREGRREKGTGWSSVHQTFGQYGYDYLRRAAISLSGLFTNMREEAIYPRYQATPDGEALTGSRTYRIIIPAGEEPPVHGFWSFTAYDLRTRDLIPNPINRFSFGDRTPGLVRRSDGAIVIALQKDRPADPSVNWLPVGEGLFWVTMRLYLPRMEVFNGSYQLPAIELIQ